MCVPWLLGEKGIFLDHIATRSRNPVDRLEERCLKEKKNGSFRIERRNIRFFMGAKGPTSYVERFLNVSLMSHQFSNREVDLSVDFFFKSHLL